MRLFASEKRRVRSLSLCPAAVHKQWKDDLNKSPLSQKSSDMHQTLLETEQKEELKRKDVSLSDSISSGTDGLDLSTWVLYQKVICIALW